MIHRVHSAPTRRRLCAAIAGALLLPVTAATSHRAAAQDDAAALLEEAATNLGKASSFHFEITTPRGETRFASEFTLLSLAGDVVRPDSFQAVAEVDAVVARLNLTVIGIGSRVWVTDPLAAEGGFREIDLGGEPGGSSFTDLVNPDRLLLSAVETIEEPAIAGQEEIDGVMTTRINGIARLTPRVMGEIGGTPMADAIAAEGLFTDTPLQVAVWIDDARMVRQLDIYGPLLEAEAANTVRRLTLSKYDEPVDIRPPTPVPE